MGGHDVCEQRSERGMSNRLGLRVLDLVTGGLATKAVLNRGVVDSRGRTTTNIDYSDGWESTL